MPLFRPYLAGRQAGGRCPRAVTFRFPGALNGRMNISRLQEDFWVSINEGTGGLEAEIDVVPGLQCNFSYLKNWQNYSYHFE